MLQGVHPCLHPGKRHRGMTLFEVILAMAILVAVAGGVLLTLRTAVETSVRVARIRDDDMLTTAFIDLMRMTLRTLPPPCRFQALLDRSEGVPHCTLSFSEPGNTLGFGRTGFDRQQVRLEVERRPGGLMVAQLLAEPRVRKVGEKPVPLVLLDDVEVLAWRFFDPRNSAWQEEWPDTGFRPSAVELRLKRQGRPEVVEVLEMSAAPSAETGGQGGAKP